MSGLTIALPKDAAARAQALAMIDHRLRTLPPNRTYVLELKEQRPRHTDEQRGYLFGVVYATIANYCGCATDDVHDELKRKFLAVGMTDGGIVRVRSVAKLSVDELSQYLEQVIAWAETDLGVMIPPAFGGFRAA